MPYQIRREAPVILGCLEPSRQHHMGIFLGRTRKTSESRKSKVAFCSIWVAQGSRSTTLAPTTGICNDFVWRRGFIAFRAQYKSYPIQNAARSAGEVLKAFGAQCKWDHPGLQYPPCNNPPSKIKLSQECHRYARVHN